MQIIPEPAEPPATTERLAYSIEEAAALLGCIISAFTALSSDANSNPAGPCAANCSCHAPNCCGCSTQSNGEFMFKRNTQSTGTAIRVTVEKKGFKRAEAAIYLGITAVTIDRLTKRGLLHPSRALRHPIYSRDDLDRFL
jgi:hypothetical protein